MQADDPTTLVGVQIGPYAIRKHLARGGMADVYLAEDEDLKRPAAIKVMLAALAADDAFVARFQREARIVARLAHPNIVQIYSVGLTPGQRPYIAMQYVDGEPLGDTLRRLAQAHKLMPTVQVLGIVRQVADALATAHRADVIHRDIKPNNILLRQDGVPFLVDLGIAAVQSGPRLTRTGSLIGTPYYMSPEQASGQQADERSDLYALGVVLYELLTGQPPFVADEPIAVLHKQVYEQPVPVGRLRLNLSPQTQQLVELCLQKDPAKRFQTAHELVQFIDRALAAEGGGGQVSPSGAWQPQPTSVTPLSRAQLLQPAWESQGGPTRGLPAAGRRWLWLLPLIGLLGVGGWLVMRGGAAPAAAVRPTAAAVTVAGPAVTSETAVAAVPPTSTTAPTLTPLPAPTATPIPAPTATPIPAATASAWPTPTASASPTAERGPVRRVVGRSVQNAPIEVVRFGSGARAVLFIGGLHAGAAPGTVTLANRAITYFTQNPTAVPETLTVYVMPSANPDSPLAPGELAGRLNANGVDLNRNWDCRWTADAKWRGIVVPGSGGTAPFSEPETMALRDFILDVNPVAVIFWEARATGGLASPGACSDRTEVSATLTEVYGLAAGYQIGDFENITNQELNGDGTNWLDDRGIPAAAILLPEYAGDDWPSNLAGIEAVLRLYE